MKAEVVTPWAYEDTGHRFSSGWIAEVFLDYRDQGLLYSDRTGQSGYNMPPDPNLFVVNVEASSAVIDLIDNDNKYYILWREGEAENIMEQNEFGQLRSYLAQNGASQAQIEDAVTTDVDNFSNRVQVVTRLKGWLRTLCSEPPQIPPKEK